MSGENKELTEIMNQALKMERTARNSNMANKNKSKMIEVENFIEKLEEIAGDKPVPQKK